MNRRLSMARFNESIPEEKLVGYCNNCSDRLYAGYDVVKHEHETFCEVSCFLTYMDVKIEPIILQ